MNVLLQKLPLELHARDHKYRFESDAYAFVLGRLLLKPGLESLSKDLFCFTLQILFLVFIFLIIDIFDKIVDIFGGFFEFIQIFFFFDMRGNFGVNR